MATPPFTADTVIDALRTFELGIHSGIAPDILPKNQLAYATNCTMRGSFVTHRPPYRKIQLRFADSAIETVVKKSLFQGASYYQPDFGLQNICAAIAGRLYEFTPDESGGADVRDITGSYSQDPLALQEWLWQSEKWLVWNDGINQPVVWDGSTTRRLANAVTPHNTTTTETSTGLGVTPAVGSQAVIHVSTVTNMALGDELTITGAGKFILINTLPSDGIALRITIQNNGYGTGGVSLAYNTLITWRHPNQLYTAPYNSFTTPAVGNSAVFQSGTAYNSADRQHWLDSVITINGVSGTFSVIDATNWNGTPGYLQLTILNSGSGQANVTVTFMNGSTTGTWYTSYSTYTRDSVTGWTTPAVNQSKVLHVTSTSFMEAGSQLTIGAFGVFTVTAVTNATTITIINYGSGLVGSIVPLGTAVNWSEISGTALPVGTIGAYIMGRNWVALNDRYTFVASDLVGSGGTAAENYRDAVLSTTENTQLADGRAFSIPGNMGKICAIVGTSVIDASMGQGPVQIHTPNGVFSCDASMLLSEWKDVTNPIVTQILVGAGGLGQLSTVSVNGDIIMRASAGWWSLIIGRRDFVTWGNTSLSLEMQRLMQYENLQLMHYSTGTFFDNRMLGSAMPAQTAHGVYHTSLVALNFDLLSSVRGKSPAAWDGEWNGLNIMQLVRGTFLTQERQFAIVLNTETDELELWELLRTSDDNYLDNGTAPIQWSFETGKILKDEQETPRRLKRLIDGELLIDKMIGPVSFRVSYAPDAYSDWILWREWTEPYTSDAPIQKHKPRIGLGEPSPKDCDPFTNRPMREGYEFRLKVEVTGHCRIRGIRGKAITLPEPTFAKPTC